MRGKGQGRAARPDEIKVLKAAGVRLGDSRIALLLYVAKYVRHKNVIRGTWARVDSPEWWECLVGGLRNSDSPASNLLLSDVCIPSNLAIHMGSRYLDHLRGAKWLGKKLFETAMPVDEFLHYNSTKATKFATRFGGIKLEDLEDREWVFESHQSQLEGPRKRKIIY